MGELIQGRSKSWDLDVKPQKSATREGKWLSQDISVSEGDELKSPGQLPVADGKVSRFLARKRPQWKKKFAWKRILGYAGQVFSKLGTLGSLVGAVCMIGGIAFPPVAIIGFVSTCLFLVSVAFNIASNSEKHDASKKGALWGQIAGYATGIAGAVLSAIYPVTCLANVLKIAGSLIASVSFYADLRSDYRSGKLHEEYPGWMANLVKIHFEQGIVMWAIGGIVGLFQRLVEKLGKMAHGECA